MAYIGREPTIGNFQVCDAISVVNGQAAYTMQVSSVNVVPETANHMIVSLNGIIQAPGSSFTVAGSTITFASNLVTGDVINFIHILGSVLDLGVPSDDTVTAAKLNNDIISGQTALATAPDDTDEFLVSDAGTLKRIDYSLIKGGGEKTLLLTTNLSDTASITVNNTYINSTYRDYYFVFSNIHPQNDTVGLRATYSEDNGSSFLSSNYQHANHGLVANGSASGINADTNAGYIRLQNAGLNDIGNGANESSSSFGYIFNPLSTVHNTLITGQSICTNTANNIYVTKFAGRNSSTGATNAVKFNFSSGNFETGQFRFYGVT